jgi:hypothetical protein
VEITPFLLQGCTNIQRFYDAIKAQLVNSYLSGNWRIESPTAAAADFYMSLHANVEVVKDGRITPNRKQNITLGSVLLADSSRGVSRVEESEG